VDVTLGYLLASEACSRRLVDQKKAHATLSSAARVFAFCDGDFAVTS